jgi:hypothetical protein
MHEGEAVCRWRVGRLARPNLGISEMVRRYSLSNSPLRSCGPPATIVRTYIHHTQRTPHMMETQVTIAFRLSSRPRVFSPHHLTHRHDRLLRSQYLGAALQRHGCDTPRMSRLRRSPETRCRTDQLLIHAGGIGPGTHPQNGRVTSRSAVTSARHVRDRDRYTCLVSSALSSRLGKHHDLAT